MKKQVKKYRLFQPMASLNNDDWISALEKSPMQLGRNENHALLPWFGLTIAAFWLQCHPQGCRLLDRHLSLQAAFANPDRVGEHDYHNETSN